MSAPQSTEVELSAIDKSRGKKKKMLWAVVFIALLMFLGSYIGVIAYVRFGGQLVKDFCSQDLVGKYTAEVKLLAANSGLEIVAEDGWLRVTTNPNMARHSCRLTLEAGKVRSAKAYFRL